MGRKNIKVSEDLFEELREDKGDQQSWPHYLEEQCLDGERVDLTDAKAVLDALQEEVNKIPERTADEIEGRMR